MAKCVRIEKILPRTSFDGKDGKVFVQPCIVENGEGTMLVEFKDRQVNEFDDQKVAAGDVLTLSLRYRLSQFKTRDTQQDAYVNHIEVNGFMVIARKEDQAF